jgi:hypothetical protein
MHIFNIHANIQQNKRLFIQKWWEELAGQMMYSNGYIEYVVSFLKNDKVQQHIILPNMNENQNP